MCEPGSPVYVTGPRRFGRGEVVRTRRDGRLLIRFAWCGTEHAVKAEHVRPLEHTAPVPLPVLPSLPVYGGKLAASPKPEPPYRSESYRAWVRAHPCAVCGTTVSVEAHHHPRKMHGTRGRKCSDLRTIPLCALHHLQHHDGKRLGRDWAEEQISLLLIEWAEAVGDDPR